TLSCMLREDNYTIAVTDAKHQRGPLATVCSPALPYNVAVPPLANFHDFVSQVSSEQAALLATPGFLLDLIARDPLLREQADLQARAISNVAVVLGQAGLPPGAKLGLVVSETGCALLTDGSFSPKELSGISTRMTTVALRLATTDTDTPLG